MGGRPYCNLSCIQKHGGFKACGYFWIKKRRIRSPYLSGEHIHYCSGCTVYFDTERVACQCCGTKMRVRPNSRFQSRRNSYWDEIKDATRI